MTYDILVSSPGMEPVLPTVKCGLLTTGPPGNSHNVTFTDRLLERRDTAKCFQARWALITDFTIAQPKVELATWPFICKNSLNPNFIVRSFQVLMEKLGHIPWVWCKKHSNTQPI